MKTADTLKSTARPTFRESMESLFSQLESASQESRDYLEIIGALQQISQQFFCLVYDRYEGTIPDEVRADVIEGAEEHVEALRRTFSAEMARSIIEKHGLYPGD